MFGRWSLRGSFSVDGYAFDFKFHRLNTYRRVSYLSYSSEQEGLRCILTNDPTINKTIVAKSADFATNTTATLEARGEKFDLGMMRHSIRAEAPQEDESFTVYLGLISHDFEHHGHYVGAVWLVIDSGGHNSKSRPRRRWRKVELPELNLPDLFPYPIPAQ